MDWARSLVGGHGEPAGAFYLAPLYPHLLAGFLQFVGESWRLLYVIAAPHGGGRRVLPRAGRPSRESGRSGALLAASMALLYHPAAFFASRPIGEPVALLLAALGVYLYSRSSTASAALAGLAFGLATLARPNLLLIAAGLALVEAGGPEVGQGCWPCRGVGAGVGAGDR